MPFSIGRYARTRPFLYHLTARENVARIRRTRKLDCAAALFAAAGMDGAAAQRRSHMLPVRIGDEVVWIRDQMPLHAGNVRFLDGWTFTDLVRDLNARVFFWPGTERGPIAYGTRHFERYRADDPVILRVRLLELLETNRECEPHFCKFNSGSPRCSGGVGSARGRDTFVTSGEAQFGPSAVVEVTFRGTIGLPNATATGDSPNGPWNPLI